MKKRRGVIDLEHFYNEFLISDDKKLLKVDTILGFLSRSYWANNREAEKIKQSIENSVCIGIYHEKKQVGFARIVTDWATMYYLCDVFIDEDYRGKGLGKKLIEVITEQYEGMMGLLGTRDGHGLYEKFGFKRNAEVFMNKRPQ